MTAARFEQVSSNYSTITININNLGWTKLKLIAKGTTGQVKTWRYNLDGGSYTNIGSTVGTEFSLGSSWQNINIQLAGIGTIQRTLELS